jgi:hypothetical protein
MVLLTTGLEGLYLLLKLCNKSHMVYSIIIIRISLGLGSSASSDSSWGSVYRRIKGNPSLIAPLAGALGFWL